MREKEDQQFYNANKIHHDHGLPFDNVKFNPQVWISFKSSLAPKSKYRLLSYICKT